MITVPAPISPQSREEWPDADFDLPDGDHIRSLVVESDKEDEDDGMDWDTELDFGKTGGAKAKAVVSALAARNELSRLGSGGMVTIRPPLTCQEEEEEEEDEGVSTIKVAQLPKATLSKPPPTPIDEDFESAFALPSDLTQLSLVPLPLSHRSSKNSLEWGDKDQTSSSQSSDAYSTLGFADACSSNSASSISLPGTEESDCEENESELEGLVIPLGLFESCQSGKHLKRLLEIKKKTQIADHRVKAAYPDPEDDFEMGLVIEDDDDFNPSRLVSAKQPHHLATRSKSPARAPPPARPPSRLRTARAKSPVNPPISSARQLQRIKVSSSPPPPATISIRTYKEALATAPPISTNTLLSSKPGSLRGQKSHSGLKPPTPPSQRRGLTRKASLSSLMETGTSQAAGSETVPSGGSSTVTKPTRYDAPTAASRAKSHTSSTSRLHAFDFMVPPTRPSTPSSNPAALRLTMPTSLRVKSRPSLASVFPGSSPNPSPQATHRATSPIPPRPPSTSSLRKGGASAQMPSITPSTAPKLLRRPKRQRTYGDGTELDGFDDLPTDRDKEHKFRIQPKAMNRSIVNGALKSSDKEKETGTMRKKGRREGRSPTPDSSATFIPSTNTLRRTGRFELSKVSVPTVEPVVRKKKDTSSAALGHTRRKPTLIRHLGAPSGPKVVCGMKWNPLTLRWEGNDQVLRDFDAVVGTSTRPALITHLTGSSIGSPVGSFASGARKVGNMIFDPVRMCWISMLPPDEEEPDVFADLADDEDEEAWETKGGTIRASQQGSMTPATQDASGLRSSTIIVTAPSPARSRTRTTSESESDRGSRASIVYDVADDFVEVCRSAENRHRSEMKGWRSLASRQTGPFTEPDRSFLYEIRALATRKY
ncbi:hypothetical protein EDC04DRAFT_3051120 [Pisolithus marmoratus]|nr:hypothetical protein EDC04DRAFT_3051120 [Pisolithus marmoratus]